MSNFFRDNSIGFKPRHNIFSKLRTGKDTESDESNNSSIMENPFFQRTEESVKLLTPKDKPLLAKELIQSTPKSSPTKKQAEEEELEITEVREVALQQPDDVVSEKDKKESHSINDSSTINDNTSSNDVLLEAFTNTQRICSNLKIELQKQQQKNLQQKELIDQYKAEILAVTEKIHVHKNLLSLLEDQIKGLKHSKSENDSLIAELGDSYKLLNEKVKSSIAESEALKITLQQQKSLQKSLESALQQKNKELDYKKKELDECSGQLSEEKIKYTELLQQLSTSKKEITAEIQECFNKVEATSNTRVDTLQNYVNSRLQAICENIKEANVDIAKGLGMDLNQKTEKLISELGVVKDSVSTAATSTTEIIMHEVNKLYVTLPHIENIVSELKEMTANNGTLTMEFITSAFLSSVDTLLKTLQVSMESLQKLPDAICTLDNKITSAEGFENEINALKEEVHTTMLQKTETVSMLRSKDHEIEELNNNLLSKIKELEELSDKNAIMQTELSSITVSNEAYVREITRIKKENEEAITSLDSKLTAQTEISSILQKDMNDTKKEIDSLKKKHTQALDENNSIKHKYENLQQQFHKINVELVQSKAKELEFGEINRNLREQFEELESASNHTSNSFKRVNDKVHALEKEKSALNLEKLDLMDKIEELEDKLKEANNQNRSNSNLDPPKRKISSTQQKIIEDDAFALSSDDLELTNPEYSMLMKPVEARRMPSKSNKAVRRKKLLLSDDLEDSPRLKKTKRFR